jgi:hypothetical protein
MKENSRSLRVEVSLLVLSPETEHRGEVEVATIGHELIYFFFCCSNSKMPIFKFTIFKF